MCRGWSKDKPKDAIGIRGRQWLFWSLGAETKTVWGAWDWFRKFWQEDRSEGSRLGLGKKLSKEGCVAAGANFGHPTGSPGAGIAPPRIWCHLEARGLTFRTYSPSLFPSPRQLLVVVLSPSKDSLWEEGSCEPLAAGGWWPASAWRSWVRLPGRASIKLKSGGKPRYGCNLWMKGGRRSMHKKASILGNVR